MSAESVLADVIAEHMPENDGGQDGQVNRDIAAQGISALKAAGYVVVELPRSDDPSTFDFGETCQAAWLIGETDDGDTLDVAVYGESIDVSIPIDENRFDPECARELASAILAAADAAEAQS